VEPTRAQLGDDGLPRRVEMRRGRGRAPARDAIRLLDERNRDVDRKCHGSRREEILRRNASSRSVAEHEYALRTLDIMDVRVRRAVRGIDYERRHVPIVPEWERAAGARAAETDFVPYSLWGDVFWLVVIGIPVAAVCLAGLALHFVGSIQVVRVSNIAIGVQVAAALAVFVLPKTMPDRQTAEGQMCPDMESGQGWLMTGIAVSSVAVAAVALASSFIAVRRRAARPTRLLAGLGTAALVVAILLRLLITALCGYSD
jgi:hypothetical protein